MRYFVVQSRACDPNGSSQPSWRSAFVVLAYVLWLAWGMPSNSEAANPILNTIFPAGGQAGSNVEVELKGSDIAPLTTLTSSAVGLRFQIIDKNKVRISIPESTAPGLYDLRALSASGLSSTRTFAVGRRPELVEQSTESENETPLAIDTVVNGRISQGGQIDTYRFQARRGQHPVIECWAERIDSQLRAVMELYDDSGRRLAVNRGFVGNDPLIDFQVPRDGEYVIKVYDLVYSGGDAHIYRLLVDTGPRIVFSSPAVLRRGSTQRVQLYGWNLQQQPDATAVGTSGSAPQSGAAEDTAVRAANVDRSRFDRLDVDITPPNDEKSSRTPLRLRPSQIGLDGFAYQHPAAQSPFYVGLTDVSVVQDAADNHVPDRAQPIDVPCEISGTLAQPDERDWFAVDVRRGEVLWIEVFGDRMGAPLDPDVSILDASGTQELVRFHDEVHNPGRKRFPAHHLDPRGRWVAPADGRFLILVHSLIGSLGYEPRRLYRLSVRREEPAFDLCVVPRTDKPVSLNVERGGRSLVDVLAFRRRGLTSSIRVTAVDLPPGIQIPDVWLGPGVNTAPLVITASKTASDYNGPLRLQGFAEERRAMSAAVDVQAATVVRDGLPSGWSRITDTLPLAVSGHAPIRIIANGHEKRKHHLYGEMDVRHSPGSILDVAVQIERPPTDQAAVKLFGVNLPPLIRNCTATIPAGRDKGYLSFQLPPSLPIGRYTMAVRAETAVVANPDAEPAKRKTRSVTVYSNPVTFEVFPAAFIVEIDAEAPTEIRRGKRVQIKYTARRINGFINKIHTELAAPDEVLGLRGRGVTFVGQSESGTIQIVANDDAQLGRQPFLRLYAVGVVEDQAVYHGSCFLNLGVVE